MSDQAGSSSWVYDANNRPTSEARTQNRVTKTASYTYFANGLLATQTTFTGQTVSFGYDAALRLVSQTDPNDGGRTISYSYDSEARRTAVTFPSGVSQQVVYDAAGRMDVLTLQKSDGTLLQRFDYDYGIDANGNLTADYWNGHVRSVTELDGSQVSYGYDELNRLVSAMRGGTHPFSQSYTYDANDNRTSITSGGITTNAIYDAANQLTSQGSTSYSYDRNGNVLSSGDMKFVYDAANRMVGGSLVTNGAS